jgi:hypothetical protein
MRSSFLLPILLAFSSPVVAAVPAVPECAVVHKGMAWQRGTLVKVLVEERAEGGGPSSVIPAQPDGEPPAGGTATQGQILRLVLKSGEHTWVAQCAVGTKGCDPSSLEGGATVSFVILETKAQGKTLVFARRDGHLICARVGEPL